MLVPATRPFRPGPAGNVLRHSHCGGVCSIFGFGWLLAGFLHARTAQPMGPAGGCGRLPRGRGSTRGEAEFIFTAHSAFSYVFRFPSNGRVGTVVQ